MHYDYDYDKDKKQDTKLVLYLHQFWVHKSLIIWELSVYLVHVQMKSNKTYLAILITLNYIAAVDDTSS